MFLWKINSQSLGDNKKCFHNHSASGESKISLTEMHDVSLRLLHAKIVVTTQQTNILQKIVEKGISLTFTLLMHKPNI